MSVRHGTLRVTWELHVNGAEGDPEGLLALDRQAIAHAIAAGETHGELTEQVLYDGTHEPPTGVVPIETGGDP